MQLDDELLDHIYEAAAVPELWPGVLEHFASIAGAQAGALVAIGAAGPVGHISSRLYDPAYSDYAEHGSHLQNPRPIRHLQQQYPGFLSDLEVSTVDELANDEIYNRFLFPHGLRWTAGTVITSPSFDMMVVDVARAKGHEPFERQSLERLDGYRPHLARAALLAARLGLRAARDMTEAMQLLGLPAIALNHDGRPISTNSLAEALDGPIQFPPFDRVRLASQGADALLSEALERSDGVIASRSIPLAATPGQRALVVHLVPVRGAASDVFASATRIMLLTEVGVASAPTAELLSGLFDLTPAEARVARALATGLSIEDTARHFGVSMQTVRNQLRAVFVKTATTRQSELLSLLAGSTPFRHSADIALI